MSRDDGSDAITNGASRGWAGQLVGLAIAIACIAFVATRIDVASLTQALLHFDVAWLAPGLACLALGYATRIARWAMMLRAAGADVSMAACAAPFLGSIALNNVLPFRAGDVVRALVFPAQLGVERTTSTASLLLERLMDLAALVLCLGIGMATLGVALQLPPTLQRVIAIAAIGTALAVVSLVFAAPVIASLLVRAAARHRSSAAPFVQRALDVAARLMQRIAAMSRPRVLFALALLSVPVWLGEAGLYYALMRGLDIPTGGAIAVTVMAVTTLSTLVPSTPGYVGPFHLAAFGAVTMLGTEASQAAAFAVLAHFVLWAATTLAGAIAILIRRDLFAKRADATPRDLALPATPSNGNAPS